MLKKLGDAELMNKDCSLVDRYYIVGSNINYNLGYAASSLDIGYYSYPPILSEDELTFWLSDMAPYMIIDKAASIVFKAIGEDKDYQNYAAAAREGYLALRKDLFSAE